MVSAGGGLVGLLLARAALGMLTAFVGRFTPWTSQIAIDGGVLAFTAVTALVTGMVFGVVPALAARRRVMEAMRDGGAQGGESRARQPMRSLLVVAQVAVAFVPLSNITPGQQAIVIEGDAGAEPRSFLVDPNVAGESYFATLGIAMLAGREIRSDPGAYAVVGVAFLLAALASIAGPARRAISIDPLTALRAE